MHCELRDSVNLSKSERILLFRVLLENMFFEWCVLVCVFFVVRLIVCVQIDEKTNNVNNTDKMHSQNENECFSLLQLFVFFTKIIILMITIKIMIKNMSEII